MFQMKKEAFSVLGKEGSTQQGPGFIQALWEDANGHFAQIAHLAKRDGQGNLLGVWGAMTDMSRSFLPWEENFQKGLYLAGVECVDTAQPPGGAGPSGPSRGLSTGWWSRAPAPLPGPGGPYGGGASPGRGRAGAHLARRGKGVPLLPRPEAFVIL